MTAGFVNVVSILATGYTVSHNTGTLSHSGINLGRGNFGDAFIGLGIILAFILGVRAATVNPIRLLHNDLSLCWQSATVGFFIRVERFHPNRKVAVIAYRRQ